MSALADVFNVAVMLTPVFAFLFFIFTGNFVKASLGMLAMAALSCLLSQRINRQKLDPSNKLVMITGCDSGFGEAVSKKLHSLGYVVVAVCYNKATAPIRSEVCSTFHILEADVRRDADLVRLRDDCTAICEEKDLRFWALINNAGIADLSWIEMFPMDKFENVLEVNYFAPLRLTQLMLPLVRKGRGRVVNTCSSTAYLNIQKMCAYSSGKDALIYATHILDKEIEQFNCRAIVIAPWMYRTKLLDEERQDKAEAEYWTAAPLDVQAAYGGEDGLKAQQRARRNTTLKFELADLKPVVDCFVAAVHHYNPRPQYNPGLVPNQIMAWLLVNLPSRYADYVREKAIKIPRKKQAKSD